MIDTEQPEEFEQQLQAFLADPTPEPKYSLWQIARFCQSKQESKQGRICGMYFTRVAIAYETGTCPGWYYFVEVDFEHVIIHEGDIIDANIQQNPLSLVA
ncbi:hypothetical protein NIES2135_27110 [Leptolyngbya boryana NIES-2135]|jgi:hypothetical protein|uniref:Uncharacterized protein n=1 Tax=Leptolyngbya boryana NIES-2135 TaxID=1973484 RepID=A0A1Z4JGK3_LEPBY|nr:MULTISPECIES: hypothetical protein [Leptolyngbya]BAY55886.1 hypothetical protein NIES2135_27110 [Leptolyngbya boryana NIES-2135]MBD2368810.1 hypothetical protein [Leptolyngbya sp. FACHB-161]MBD2375322.1 hypothetical protein [Leptolyngbya sp. FACHB-238]MBD2399740.1 hypothetical protein [Leptolyngbya sp. FACHB-239]MBD2405946.1 hypothetical protein [Leptolyngbya sp. FACHB-402]